MRISKLGAHEVVQSLRQAGSFKLAPRGRGRVRTGKTRDDHKSGAWASRFSNRQKPIRCTSSHPNANGMADMRDTKFWCG